MKRIVRGLGLVLAMCIAAAGAHAQSGVPCSESSRIVGRCFVIYGRLSAYNGAPTVRIWWIGKTSMFGVHDGAGMNYGDAVLPPKLAKLLGPDLFKVNAIGTYYLCPLSYAQPRHMQFVCIRDAWNIAVKQVDGP